MAKKLVAVFLMFIVVVAALHIREAEAHETEEEEKQYKECLGNCLTECENDNANGRTFCEMSCDTECANKESAEKLKHIKV